jgi:hypothetical protein
MKDLAVLLFIPFLAQSAQAQRLNLNSSAFQLPGTAHVRSLAGDIPAPVSDVETAGPRVTLLLNADASNRRAPVWPGYDVFGQPVLLYEAGVRSFLIAHPNPPEGYAALFQEPRQVYVKQGPIPGFNFTFQFHFPLNGADTFAYRYKADGNPAQDVHTTVHERFHVFQKTFKPGRYGVRAGDPDGEDLAMAALEQKTLKAALFAADAETAAGYVRQFIAVREARYARFPDARLPETYEERSEGTARYVEQALMLRPEVAPQPGGQPALLARSLDFFPDIDSMTKSRYYATGASQGLLLDRAGRGDWKALVSGGASPYEVTRQAFPLSDPAAALAAARGEHGYEKLLAIGLKKAADFQAAKAAAIAAYDALPGLEWAVPSANNMGYSAASPSYKLSDKETLMPTTYMVDAKMEGYAFNVTDRPVVLGDREVRFHAAPVVTLDGRPLQPADGVYRFETLEVSEPGLDLRVSRPGTLTVTGLKAEVTLF